MITPEGDYLSRPDAYDLRPHFKHLHWRVMPHSQGHLVASDWADQDETGPYAFYKNCGLWTRDEASILMDAALKTGGEWVDIGAHTGWTSKHINWGTNRAVLCVDPMLKEPEFRARWAANTNFPGDWGFGETAISFFTSEVMYNSSITFRGFCIDGDHELGEPLKDAKHALDYLAPSGTIVFHDGIGRPVREAVTFLLNNGFKARCYFSPHLVFVCWRGDFQPMDHTPDPRINWEPHLREMRKDFDFSRLS